jgi:2-polyprenyl-3-methyl-5-hydroxy-6-metoxy-1,4-benzoquinol methylase
VRRDAGPHAVVYLVVVWPCPVCGGVTNSTFIVRSEYLVRSCSHCTHRFVAWLPPPDHVARTYSDSYFFDGGAGYPDYLKSSALLHAHGQDYARKLRPFVTPGSMLDIGAASGFICDGFRSEGWRPEALEPNQRMAQYGRSRLNLTFHSTDLEHFENTQHYDLVSMIQVIAHFVSPRSALSKTAELTRDGGFLLIETWDYRSLTARLFGKHWHEYDPPRVLHFFSRTSLEHLANQFGFHRVASGRPRKFIQWRHARSLLAHQAPWLNRAAQMLPDDLVLRYPSEDLFWTLFRKTQPAAPPSPSASSSAASNPAPQSASEALPPYAQPQSTAP